MGAEEEIRDAVLPVVQARGLEVWDVERSGTCVRVLVERPGGVDLDALSELSNAISAVLDRRDDIVPAGRYVLEVSSPGLERRLRNASHFARSIGEEVSLKTLEPIAGSRRLTGTVLAATETDVALQLTSGEEGQPAGTEPSPAGAEGEVARVPLASIVRAHRVFRWPVAKPPGRPTGRDAAKPKAGARSRPGPSSQVGPALPQGRHARARGAREAGGDPRWPAAPSAGALGTGAAGTDGGAPWPV
jgi:ribosome maturation factor RimP